MDAEEGAERLKTTYVDRLRRLNSLAEGSRRLGEADGYLSGQKDHPHGMRSLDLMRSMQVVGSALPEEVYHEALFSEEKDPAAILAYSREYQDLKPDPFVVACLARLELLAAAGPTPQGDWTSRDPEIRDLDRLRRRNRTLALKKLQKLIGSTIEQLESGDRPRAAFSDLCSTLGVLAAVYRLAGRRDDAVDLLVASRPLALYARDRKTEAEWFQKAAYVLVDLKRSSRATEFINRAHLLYDLAGAANERLRTLVDLAYVMAEDQKPEQCIEHLKVVCPLLPASDIESRFAAHQMMSGCYQALGRNDEANTELEKARSLVGDDILARTSLLSVQAEVQCQVGDLKRGAATFREILPLFVKMRDIAVFVSFTMDYAALLLKGGNLIELKLLLVDFRRWIGRLKGNSRLKTVVEDLFALAELERLDERSFVTIINEINAVIPASPHSRWNR